MNLHRPFVLKHLDEARPGELLMAGWAGGSLVAIVASPLEPTGDRVLVVLASPDPDRPTPFVSDLRIGGSVVSLGTEWVLEPDLAGPVRTGAEVLAFDSGSLLVSRGAEYLRLADASLDGRKALSLDLRSFALERHARASIAEDFAVFGRWRIRLDDQVVFSS